MTRMKRFMKRIWIPKPPIITRSPILNWEFVFALASMPPPPDCVRNERISPVTKTVVIQRVLMRE